MIFYPHKNAFDKYIIQHIVKTFIQSNSFNYEHEKNKFKVVVINNIEKFKLFDSNVIKTNNGRKQ